MKNQIKTFRLFVRPDEKSHKIANKIRMLNAQQATPLMESEDADLVIAIGGDGTFIHAVTQTHFSKKAIYTGVHTGTLGFMQDLCEDKRCCHWRKRLLENFFCRIYPWRTLAKCFRMWNKYFYPNWRHSPFCEFRRFY